MSTVLSEETSVDLVPEVKEFLLVGFTKTVSEITAKAHLVPQIETIANDEVLLQGLVERMERGSKADVRSYVDEVFESFPFGLRTSIVYSLTEIFREWQQNQRARKRQRKNDVAELFSHVVCGDLVKKWKSGTVSPSELYEGISSAVVNGSMEPQLAKRMVDLTLQDAGYIRTNNDRADFDKTKRFRADAKGFDLVNLQCVAASLDGSEIEMMTYGGISTTVSSSKHTITSKNYPSSYNMTTKGKQLWWRHEGGGDQLFFLQPESSSSRPLLLIGGSLKLENGDLDIEVVIGVDVCPHTSSDDTLSATILVDGQWLGELDRSTRGMCDGASEVGGDDDNDNNSTGSGDEDESPRVGRSLGATQTVKRRYYCVFITIINGTVIVKYVTPIHKSLVLDQHPTLILSLSPALAVVGGTNGLLGLVDASVFSLYSSLTPSVQSSSYHSSSDINESCDSSLTHEAFLPLRAPVVSNLSDLAGRVKIGSVITLKGGGTASYTTLSMPGGGGVMGDKDSEGSESVRGEERAQSFTPLTVDSFSKEVLQSMQPGGSQLSESPQNPTQVPFNYSERKVRQGKRTPLSRMRESFSSRSNVPIAPECSSSTSGPMDEEKESGNVPNNPRIFTLPTGGEVIVTHAADACITALSYSGEESCVFASGDNTGVICLWHVIDDSADTWDGSGRCNENEIRGNHCRLVRLAALPLQMTAGSEQRDVSSGGSEKDKAVHGSRINSLFMSGSGRHVAVGLWDRLLLVALGQQEDEPLSPDRDSRGLESNGPSTLPSLYIRNSLDIVTGCRAVYSVVFRSPQLHVWRLTNTPLAHPFSPSKSKVRPSGQGVGTGSRVPMSREPRPSVQSRSNVTRDREFRFFPDILRRSSTPSTCTSRTSSIFSISSPNSPVSRRRFSISSAPNTPISMDVQSPWTATALPADRSSYSGIWGQGQGQGQPSSASSSASALGYEEPSSQEMEETDETEDRQEETQLGVTVTSWLHPNVDCFNTRFGMRWNDATIFGGCFSEADDASTGSASSSLKGCEYDGLKGEKGGRQRSFSDCPTLPPNGYKSQGPQTLGSRPQTSSSRMVRQGGGIADSEYNDESRSQNREALSDRHPRGSSLPPHPRSLDLDYYNNNNRGGRRYMDGSHNLGGLLSLQTCSHPVRSESPAPQTAGWYQGSTSSSGRESPSAMDVVTRDDTDNSRDSRDSSQSNTPTITEDDRHFPPAVSISRCSTRSSLTGAVCDSHGRALHISSTAATTPDTQFSTPDMSPLHSPYSNSRNPSAFAPYRSPDHMLAHLSLSASDYRSLCLHTMLPENSHHTSSSSISSAGCGSLSESDFTHMRAMMKIFKHESSKEFQSIKRVLAIFCAALQPPSASLIAAALEEEMGKAAVVNIFLTTLSMLFCLKGDSEVSPVTLGANMEWGYAVISLTTEFSGLSKWLTSTAPERMGREFWIDVSVGHNFLCALYLKYCGNKSVAVEHPWQEYLKTHGPSHLRRSSRGLRLLTGQIRKIDETANIKGTLPRQLGFIVGLQEIYARRVGLIGRLPHELGELDQLRVLSMGNNQLCGELPASLGNLRHLQRIVLHQNKLTGQVPASLGKLGCIVNLAGNVGLEHGPDVPQSERDALVAFFQATKGSEWTARHCWGSKEPVSRWYKVGVLLSHVHSIVMSSNSMVGHLPEELQQLTQLRMVELATMTGLTGPIPTQLCSLTTLRRLCICRCGLTGEIPAEIGQLVALEELQLFGNHLSGAIPASLGNLVELKLLSLGEYTGGNDFTPRPLPSCFASLRNLEALFMANCHVRGPLPSWIGELTELRQLDLQRNSLSGAIPTAIGKLHNLLYLNVKDNERLGGTLPVAQLASLTKLNRLSLVHCNFERAEEAVGELQTHLPRCKIWV